MPNPDKEFELERLKKDPSLWKRLCMPLDESGVLGNVFMGEENPFQKDPAGAMEKIQKLAASGKLYLREKGRSKHFNKVNDDNGDLKLGEQYTRKLANRTTDPILGALMWATAGYFRWLGIGFISRWLDKKVQRREEIVKVNDRYKEEYESLTKEEKEQLKAQRKQEKIQLKARKKQAAIQKKLAKVQKQAAQYQKELDALNTQMTSTTPSTAQQTPPEAQPQQTQTPAQPQQTQPTAQQTPPAAQQTPPEAQPQQTQTPAQPQQTQPTQNQTVAGPPAGQNNENTANNNNKIVFGNKEYTPETFNKLPPNIQNAIRTIISLIEQQEAIEQQLNQQLNQLQTGVENTPQQTQQTPPEAQPQQTQTPAQPPQTQQEETPAQQDTTDQVQEEAPVNAPDQTEQVIDTNTQEQVIDINEIPAEETTQRESNLIDLDDFQPTVNENNTPTVNMEILQEIFPGTQPQPQETDAPTADTNTPMVDINALTEDINAPMVDINAPMVDINAPTEDINAPMVDINAPLEDVQLEAENVNIQNRPEDQPQSTLRERLAAERQEMNAANNWKESLANTLLSHEEAKELKAYYDSVKDDNRGTEFVTGAISGMLSDKEASVEAKLEVLEALLSGKSIGSANNDLLNKGITAHNAALLDRGQDNGKELGRMLADTMRVLARRACLEENLSTRFAMYGRVISNMAKMAEDKGIDLPLSNKEKTFVQGVVNTTEIARKYNKARQHLGQDGMDLMDPANKKHVRDLMLGNAVEKLIQLNLRDVETSKDVMDLLGEQAMQPQFLSKYATEALLTKPVQLEQVKEVLENPNSSKAYGLGTNMMNELFEISTEVHAAAQKQPTKENALETEANEQQLDQRQTTAL